MYFQSKIIYEDLFKIIDCYYKNFNLVQFKNDNYYKSEFIKTTEYIKKSLDRINKGLFKNNINISNETIILTTKNNKKVKIECDYISFSMNIYNEFIFLFDDYISDKGELSEYGFYFYKFIALFNNIIVLNKFIHEDNYICFNVFNIDTQEELVYTISANNDNTIGYFYKD